MFGMDFDKVSESIALVRMKACFYKDFFFHITENVQSLDSVNGFCWYRDFPYLQFCQDGMNITNHPEGVVISRNM